MLIPAAVPSTGKPVHASQAGAALNTSLATGGGTDDTAALQAILDTATATRPLALVIDGPALVTGLRVKSYTTIVFPPGAGLFLAPDSAKPLLCNFTRHKTVRNDARITIVGGYLNANGPNQTANGGYEDDGTIQCGMLWISCTDIVIRDLHLVKSRRWGCAFSNCDRVTVENYQYDHGGAIEQSGLNIRGPGSRITFRRCRLHSEDDALEVNARDYTGPIADAQLGPWIGGGAITDVTIEDLHLDDAWSGIGMYSAVELIDRVAIRNVHGRVHNYALAMSWNPLNDDGLGNRGNIGSVSVDGLDVRHTGAEPYPAFAEMVRVDARVRRLSLSGAAAYGAIDDRPWFRGTQYADIDTLSVSGLRVLDTEDSPVRDLIVLEGTAHTLAVSDADWWRPGDATRGGSLVALPEAGGGVAGTLRVDGGSFRRTGSLVLEDGGELSHLLVSGVRLEDPAPGAGFLSVETRAPGVTVSGCRPLLSAPIVGANAAAVADRLGDQFAGHPSADPWAVIPVTAGPTIVLDATAGTYAAWTASQDEMVSGLGVQRAGQLLTLHILNDGTPRTIAFGAGFVATGPLVGTADEIATLTFRSDGAAFHETSRTTGLAPVETVPPTLLSATVDATGEVLTLVFSEPVAGHAGFTLDAPAPAVTLAYASGDGTDTVAFTPSRPILGGETVTLDYTPGDVTDLSANPLAAITDLAVTNDSTATVSPLTFGPVAGFDPQAPGSLFQERTGAGATTPADDDGEPVGSWLDQSGDAHHATAGADGRRPTLDEAVQNGLDMVLFDGADDRLDITPVPLGTNHTAYCVFRPSAIAGFHVLMAANTQYLILFDAGGVVYYSADGVAASVAHGGLSVGTTYLFCVRRSGTTVQFFKDGSQVGANQTLSANDPVSLNAIGNRADGALPFAGHLGDVWVYDSAHAPTDRGLVDAYLLGKWGI